MDRNGWTEIWGELEPMARLEQDLGLLPGHYELVPTDRHFSLTDPIYGESKPFRVEHLYNLLTGQAWQVCITEITNGVYAILHQYDETEATFARREAIVAPHYRHADLPTLRKRVVKQMIEAITTIVEKHGHVRNRQEWVRDSAWCWSRIALQRSSGGFACYLNVDYAPKLIKWTYPPNATRVGMFAPRKRQVGGTDALFYTALDGESFLRDYMLGLLRDRVMPYLDRCHNVLGVAQRTHRPFGMMPA